MSNHDGSYLLNKVLHLLEREKVFESLGQDRSRELVLEAVSLARNYDCNPGEILEDIGPRLGICWVCLKPESDLKDGICAKCQQEEENFHPR